MPENAEVVVFFCLGSLYYVRVWVTGWCLDRAIFAVSQRE